jgi:hypothetical protein
LGILVPYSALNGILIGSADQRMSAPPLKPSFVTCGGLSAEQWAYIPPTAIFFFPAISGGAFGSSTFSLPLASSLSA